MATNSGSGSKTLDLGTLGSNPFTTTNASPTVTVADTAHGLAVGDIATYVGATTTGGLDMNGSWLVASVVDANSYTFTHDSNASSGATGGSAAVAYSYAFKVHSTDTAGEYEFVIDGSNLVAGDRTAMMIASKVRSSDGLTEYQRGEINDSQLGSRKLKKQIRSLVICIATNESASFFLEQTAGTARAVPWAVKKLGA